MEPFIGQVMMFAGNFAPRGWATCDGQLLSISEHQALFSILGTTYGGDGRTTFGLPDLRGRLPMHAGSGAGLTSRNLGQKSGHETVTLNAGQLPSHIHAVKATTAPANTESPTNAHLATFASGTRAYATGVTDDVTMDRDTIDAAGGNEYHENMPPFQVINFVIALDGIYPSRN